MYNSYSDAIYLNNFLNMSEYNECRCRNQEEVQTDLIKKLSPAYRNKNHEDVFALHAKKLTGTKHSFSNYFHNKCKFSFFQ